MRPDPGAASQTMMPPGPLPSLAPLVVSACLAFLGGCGHTEVGSFAPEVRESAFGAAEPLRLTYGGGATPQWSASPDQVAYAFGRDVNAVGDLAWCVGSLPATGGSRRSELCDTDPAARDTSTIVTAWPAPSADGRWIFEQRRFNRYGIQFRAGLILRDAVAGTANALVLPVPFFAGGKPQGGISHPAWLDPDHLVLVGRGVIRSTNDNVNSGQEIFTFAPAEGLAGLASVPGTIWASSLDLSPDRDTLYYTLGGDSRVYRRALATGAVDTLFDFGALGIVRDVRVRNGRLIAVVGGDVTWGPHASLGMAQYDNGGPIYSVDLPAGAPVLVSQSYDQYLHPALAPDGGHLVAEQFGDLWRVALP